MNFNLVERTILLTVAGSRAYGMHTENSDVDVKGVCIPTKEYFMGFLNGFEQADKFTHMGKFVKFLNKEEKSAIKQTKLEGSVYGIRKFFLLAANNNPNILDLLFCRDNDVRLITLPGKIIREHAKDFLSTKCRFTFHGYALSQLKRIELHRGYLLDPPDHKPEREEFGLHKQPDLPKNQLQAAFAAIRKKIDSWEIDFLDLDDSEKIYIKNQIAEFLSDFEVASDEKFNAAARLIGYDENFIELLDRERKYKAASDRWKKFNEWKSNRNPERSALEAKCGYDSKHASHLVRLTRMCGEILEKSEVNVHRSDAEELLEIRNGHWSYDKLMETVEKEQSGLDDLYKSSKLPRSPNRTKLNELCISLVEAAI